MHFVVLIQDTVIDLKWKSTDRRLNYYCFFTSCIVVLWLCEWIYFCKFWTFKAKYRNIITFDSQSIRHCNLSKLLFKSICILWNRLISFISSLWKSQIFLKINRRNNFVSITCSKYLIFVTQNLYQNWIVELRNHSYLRNAVVVNQQISHMNITIYGMWIRHSNNVDIL